MIAEALFVKHLASPPSMAGGKLYLAAATGQVMILDGRSGRLIESVDIESSVRFQPAVVGGRIFVGTTTGQLIAIDTGDSTADGWSMWGGAPAHNGPATSE